MARRFVTMSRVFLSCEIRGRGDSVRYVEVTWWGLNVDALEFRVGYPFVERKRNSTVFFLFPTLL